MNEERCEYCGQEERYGHNAICVMNTVEELQAEIERLRALVFAIDEKDPEKLSSWRYRREALCEMAKAALADKDTKP